MRIYSLQVEVAVDLSRQENIVLVFTHELVYKQLYNNSLIDNANLVFVFPSLQLRDDWINKLYDRYSKDKTKKNKAVWLRATNYYLKKYH